MRILAYVGRIGPDRPSRTNDPRDFDELDEDRDALAVVVSLRDRRSAR